MVSASFVTCRAWTFTLCTPDRLLNVQLLHIDMSRIHLQVKYYNLNKRLSTLIRMFTSEINNIKRSVQAQCAALRISVTVQVSITIIYSINVKCTRNSRRDPTAHVLNSVHFICTAPVRVHGPLHDSVYLRSRAHDTHLKGRVSELCLATNPTWRP
jgi:hypothetical protein